MRERDTARERERKTARERQRERERERERETEREREREGDSFLITPHIGAFILVSSHTHSLIHTHTLLHTQTISRSPSYIHQLAVHPTIHSWINKQPMFCMCVCVYLQLDKQGADYSLFTQYSQLDKQEGPMFCMCVCVCLQLDQQGADYSPTSDPLLTIGYIRS